jgi:hypothetical protein
MPNLGVFILLALLAPGVVIAGAAVLLFDNNEGHFLGAGIEVLIFLSITISFLTGHIPFVIERFIFNHIWDALYPNLHLRKKSSILGERSSILATCEAKGIHCQHMEQLLGEFIFYFNTSFWLAILATVKLTIFFNYDLRDAFAGLILTTSMFSILYTCPHFKLAYIMALEKYKELSYAA